MGAWNEFTKIRKSRKNHRCAGTGRLIPAGDSCWRFVGEYQGDFQDWYLCNQAKDFLDNNPNLFNDPDGYECSEIGELMFEAEQMKVAK